MFIYLYVYIYLVSMCVGTILCQIGLGSCNRFRVVIYWLIFDSRNHIWPTGWGNRAQGVGADQFAVKIPQSLVYTSCIRSIHLEQSDFWEILSQATARQSCSDRWLWRGWVIAVCTLAAAAPLTRLYMCYIHALHVCMVYIRMYIYICVCMVMYIPTHVYSDVYTCMYIYL